MQAVAVYFPSGAYVRAEVAADQAARQRGLTGRRAVPEDTGMLFDFGRSAPHRFWMEGTLVPLDMVFFGPDYAVVHVVKSARPLDRSTYGGRVSSRYVLEVAGGWVDRHGVTVGQRAAVFRLPT